MNAGGALQQKSVAVVIWRGGWSGGLALEEVWGTVSPGNKHSLPAVSERQTSTHLESQWENGAFSSQGESEYWSSKQNPRVLLCREEFPISSLMFVFKIITRFKSHLWKMKFKVQQYFANKKGSKLNVTYKS